MTKDNEKRKLDKEIDRRLNREATMEKLKTPKKDIKKLKTLEEMLKGKA